MPAFFVDQEESEMEVSAMPMSSQEREGYPSIETLLHITREYRAPKVASAIAGTLSLLEGEL